MQKIGTFALSITLVILVLGFAILAFVFLKAYGGERAAKVREREVYERRIEELTRKLDEARGKSVATLPAASWRTYINAEAGFSIQYPEPWTAHTPPYTYTAGRWHGSAGFVRGQKPIGDYTAVIYVTDAFTTIEDAAVEVAQYLGPKYQIDTLTSKPTTVGSLHGAYFTVENLLPDTPPHTFLVLQSKGIGQYWWFNGFGDVPGRSGQEIAELQAMLQTFREL